MSDHRVPPSIERALTHLQDMGLSPSMLERFVSWWKRFGLKQAAVIVVAITLPLWRYVWIPGSVSAGLSSFAESAGAHLVVDDWRSDWSNIRVTGEDVTWTVSGPYSESRMLRADAIELDWSLWRGVENVQRRVRGLFGDAPPEEPVHAMRVTGATLHLERLLSGRWNWQDAMSLEALASKGAGTYRLPALEAEELRVVWVEHLPAASGGGLIEQKTASMYLDDVRARFSDLRLSAGAAAGPTQFAVEGRTGDGRFSATGDIVLPPLPPATRFARASSEPARTTPFTVTLYLENVGAAAFTRLVSDASLLPSAGTMTGKIRLTVTPEGQMDCDIDLQLRNVQYAPNPRSSYVQARRTAVEAGLQQFVVNEHVARRCNADWHEPQFRVAKALQAEITGEAVHGAPPVVQGAAGYDRLRFVEADQAALDRYTADMSTRIGEALGGARGAAVAHALMASDSERRSDNALTRGLRDMGRGIKRVFGGGKKKR